MADPDPLYFGVAEQVRVFLDRFSAENRVSFAPGAERQLLEQGEAFDFSERSIDNLKLERALVEIFTHVEPAQVIDGANIERAMKRAQCHYLWFC